MLKDYHVVKITFLSIDTVGSCLYPFWLSSNPALTLHFKVGEKQFWVCRRGTSPESPRSKFTVVGLRDQLTPILRSSEFTCKKRVTELNRVADASKTKCPTLITWMMMCRKSTSFFRTPPPFLRRVTSVLEILLVLHNIHHMCSDSIGCTAADPAHWVLGTRHIVCYAVGIVCIVHYLLVSNPDLLQRRKGIW